MGTITENFFGGVSRTTEVINGTSGSITENFFGDKSQNSSWDYGNPQAPAVSISPVAAAITLAVGDKKTFADLFDVTGADESDFDVASGTPANVKWTPATGAEALKAGTSTLTATGKTGGVADGLSAVVNATVVAALAWGVHPASGTIGTSVNFTFTGGIPSVDGDKYQVIVLKPDGTEHDNVNQTAKTYALNTAAGDSTGNYTVMIFDKGVKGGTTDPVDGGAKISQVVAIAAAPVKTVNGKVLDAQVGGSVVPAASLFTISNGAAYTDILTVTGTPAKVTWDAAASTLTIADDASGDIALAYTVKSGVNKGSTAPKLTGVNAKP